MDVTVILNVHGEGLLAGPACASLERAKADAERQGIAVEVVAVLDRPDPQTREFLAERAPADWRVTTTDFGDAGLARNAGVELAEGRWIAFLDGDDLFGIDWLSAAYAAAEADPRLVVWHPEVNVYFGDDRSVFRHLDMDEDDVDPADLVCANAWTALCFAPRTLLETAPYAASDLRAQIGFEDWSWNVRVLGLGAIHKVVPGSGHMIRVQAGSLMRRTAALEAMPRPTGVLRRMLQARAAKGPADQDG
jgi:glycosyltransferase involved in cell wall biosynthesis